MRTTKSLMKATCYKSGKTAYKGAILSAYASTYHQQMTMQPQISNGGKVLLPVDSEIKSACSGLQKGQIGARRASVKIEGKTTILHEGIAECYDLDKAREIATSGKQIEEILEPVLNYTDSNGNNLKLSQVIEMRSQAKENNSAIRERIENLKKIHNFKNGSKMSEDLMNAIRNEMANYVSVTGLDLALIIRDKHVINKTDDYVTCSDYNAYSKLLAEANYNDQGDRLVARNTPVKFIVPIQRLEQINQVKEAMVNKFTCTFLAMDHTEVVASDTYPVDGLDLAAAKRHDAALSGSN